MNRQTTSVTTAFALLLAVTLAGIIYHYATGYHYPATPASTFELNVLGDLYEAFFLVPAGLVGIWCMRKRSV